MRTSRDFQRQALLPDEFSQLVMRLTQAGLFQRVFLISGIVDGCVRNLEGVIATAEILSSVQHYRVLLHLIIMPGAEDEQILAGMCLANWVYINLDAPNASRLPKLTPVKDFENQLLRPFKRVTEIRRTHNPRSGWQGKWPPACTRF